MTDEEIEKALELCFITPSKVVNFCVGCPYEKIGGCRKQLAKDTLDYINRLKAENERLMKAHINELELLACEMKNGEIDMKFGGELCDVFVYSIVQMFKQNHGKNFVTTTFEMDDRGTSDRYALTIQKVGGETPTEQLSRIKTEKEDMHGELMSLQAYIDNHEEIWKQNAEIERKKTADSIFRDLCGALFITKTGDEVNFVVVKPKHLMPIFKKYGVKDYGVEVDDE